MTYNLYVPAPGVKHDILPQSAIVGEERGDYIETHYEGGRASNVQSYEDRIQHAAGRRIERYPTSALRAWKKDELIKVGTVTRDENLKVWLISEIIDEPALRSWIGDQDRAAEGGSDHLHIEAAGRLFSKLAPMDQARIISRKLSARQLSGEVISAFQRRA